MDNCLFTRLLIRFIKNNGLYPVFSTNIKKNNYKAFINTSSIFCSNSLEIINKRVLDSDKSHCSITSFLLDKSNQKLFNQIIIATIQNDFVNFLIENNLLDKFIINLQSGNEKYNNLKSIPALLYFLDNSIKNGTPLETLLNTAFIWGYSNEGFLFWLKINKKFKKYMIKILTE